MSEVSATRLYLGNLPRAVTKADVQAHFEQHGTGEITEIKLMNGFGFIEYKDALDARDVVPAFHGSTFMGERLTVQFARGSRARESFGHTERVAPRPRRTPFRMMITGLPIDTSWQDLKDFARQSSLDVVYSETPRDGFGRGYVEFETATDLRSAVDTLDGREFKPGHRVNCSQDVHPNEVPQIQGRGRSRSPIRRPPYLGVSADYDRRQTHRTYSPRRDGYRDDYREEYDYRRTISPGRDHFDDRTRYRSPPRPTDDYGPRQNRYEDAFRRNYPNSEPFPARAYDRAPSRVIPPRDLAPRDIGFQTRDGGIQPRDGGFSSREGGYPRDYERGRYW